MNNIVKGVIAGFAATVVLSLLMMMKSAMGLMPELDIIAMLSAMMGSGFMIGSIVWGVLFAFLAPKLPGVSFWLKGVYFGIVAWVLMMVVVMPMAGAGFFGMKFGMVAPVMTLVLHLIYGAVLGGVYLALQNRGNGQLQIRS
jgi:uncharacterized membrane protein YagU involved in acid resistance